METARIARILDEMGTLLEVRGENPFRCRAYHNAAQALKGLPSDLSEMIADGSLAEVPGIGETMLAKITQLATTGHLPAFEDLKKATPPGLVALLRVPGLGPKKIKTLHDDLKVESLADLRRAGESGKIAGLKGFGAKTEAKILEGIDFLESVGDRILQSTARRLIAPILEAVRDHPGRDPGRGLREPPAAGRDDRRPRHPLQLDRPVAGPRPLRQAARGRQGPRPRADQGERPAARRRPVRPPGRLRRAVPVRPPLLHRLEGPQHRHEAAGDRPRAQAQRVRPRRRRTARSPAGPRPTSSPRSAWPTSRPSFARTRASSSSPRRAPCPAWSSVADLTGTFHCHTDWSDGGATLAEMAEARAGRRPVVSRDRRPLAVGRLRRGA